jgi:two-component system, NarL family, response regulator NreC
MGDDGQARWGSRGGVADQRPLERPIRVLVVDRHALLRRTLCALLEGEDDFEVIAEAEQVGEITRHVLRGDPQALVIDMSFPGGESLRTIRRVRLCSAVVAIIATGVHESAAFARAAVDAGADCYVLKEKADSELAEAIRVACRARLPAASSRRHVALAGRPVAVNYGPL